MEWKELLRGAYDIHIHCAPDVIPRSQDVLQLAEDASKAGMAGIGLKDHTASTVGQAYVLNKMYPGGPRFFSSITLNPPVGGLNPSAVEAALRSGADIVYFPTYGSRKNIMVMEANASTNNLPVNEKDFKGIYILDEKGNLKPQVVKILELILKYDAVLATGHISPAESITLIREAQRLGIRKMIATHVSQSVPGMSIQEQREAAVCGAFIEHSFLVATNGVPDPISLETIRDQIRSIGVEKVILSSDFGKASIDKPVSGFACYLNKMIELGFSKEEIQIMISHNPKSLLEENEC